jgi:carboxynorspermidine decarboxylase
MPDFDFSQLPTPSYAIDEILLEKNLQILDEVQKKSGAKIILALKGFACHYFAPLIRKYLPGVTASSLFEAHLGHEIFQGEVHACAPAFIPHEMEELVTYLNHITFNSLNEWKRHQEICLKNNIQCGLRINPEHSEGDVLLYDPCAPNSRLGIKAFELENFDFDGITGLHFHTLCEKNSDSLMRTLKAVTDKFDPYLKKVKWVNFGGGHHITRSDYDLDLLINLIKDFKAKYDVEVYLEPGEAIALHTGYLVVSVLDILNNDKKKIAILDTSATNHMPDVLEMPYRPMIIHSGLPEEKNFNYLLGGMTCLAGDIIGEYSFDQELKIGDKLIFTDMAHYTMVKNTMFNGVNLPHIIKINSDKNNFEIIRTFHYEDYKNRLS